MYSAWRAYALDHESCYHLDEVRVVVLPHTHIFLQHFYHEDVYGEHPKSPIVKKFSLGYFSLPNA
jgi:hypothetical protein